MKRDLLLRSVFFIFFMAALASCDTATEKHYVELGQVYCSFPGEGGSPLQISITSSPNAWEAVPNADWIKAERSEDGATLTVTVDDNRTEAERNAFITVTAGEAKQEIEVNQLTAAHEFTSFRKLDMFQLGAVMSPSGIYVGGFVASIGPDDSWMYTPTIIDVRTHEKYEFGPYPESLYYLTQPAAITDQGILFIDDGLNGGQVSFNLQTGEVSIPQPPQGIENKPKISATSADGRFYAGWAQEKRMGLYKPLLWTDGEGKTLTMPEKNYRNQEFTTGIMARGMSADGKVIYGTTWENYDFGMVYWKDGKVDWVGKDIREVTTVTMISNFDGSKYDYNIVNGCICQAQNKKISPSGKWIATTYRTETQTEDQKGVIQEKYAAFYNTETEKTIVIKDYGTSTGLSVTDEGIGFIGLGDLGIVTGIAYDLNTGTELGPASEWVKNNYGIVVPDGYISYIAPNGVALGTSARTSARGTDFIKWYITPVTTEQTAADR